MRLTDEQLEVLGEYASLLFSPREIALVLNLDFTEFIDEITNEKAQAYRVYNLAIIDTKKRLRAKNLKLAEQGSPVAQAVAEQYIADLKVAENDDLQQ